MSNLLLYRILSGKLQLKIHGQVYVSRSNTLEQKYAAELYFQDLVAEYSELDYLQTPAQLTGFLAKFDYWNDEKQELAEKYKKDIENLKIKAFESAFRSNEKAATKQMIAVAKQKLENIFEEKHRFDCLTPQGAALLAKNKYLIATSIYLANGEPLFGNSLEAFLTSDFPYLDNIIIEINRQSASTTDIRAVARSENWRKYWCAKECDNIFSKAAIELTDEQLNLISWTRLYDNVYQHPDCPVEEIIEDDDCLDGFLIVDKRKRDKDKGVNNVEQTITNPMIKGAAEIFVVAETKEDALKIYELNEDSSKRIIREREKLIEKQGSVNDQELPDIKRKRQLAINQKSVELTGR